MEIRREQQLIENGTKQAIMENIQMKVVVLMVCIINGILQRGLKNLNLHTI